MKLHIILGMFILIVLAGCIQYTQDKTVMGDHMDEMEEEMEEHMEEMGEEEMTEKAKETMDTMEQMPKDGVDWKITLFTDVLTGTPFKIADFAGKKVLVESFAVWCPVCTRQQKNMKELHQELGDSIISVSLNTDPNEDVGLVKSHAEKNQFDWRYAVAPIEVGKALVDEYGLGVVNAPSAPVILVCEDQSSRLMQRGLKSVDELKEEIEAGC